MEDSGLLPTSVELLKSLLYPHGSSLLLFADFEPAVRRLPDEHERRQFMKAVSRKETLLARVKIDADTDVEALANYWGVGGRRKDLVPFLTSLRRIEKGCKLNIVYLLPHFARDRLYNHPYTPADPAGKKQDCFWTALNLFNDVADDRFCSMDFVGQSIKSDYYSILEPTQFGDLIFLTTRDDTVVHAAVFLADDIVFTKNGESYTQPWILMHLGDMVNTYAVRHPTSGPMKVLYYRKKIAVAAAAPFSRSLRERPSSMVPGGEGGSRSGTPFLFPRRHREKRRQVAALQCGLSPPTPGRATRCRRTWSRRCGPERPDRPRPAGHWQTAGPWASMSGRRPC